MKKIFTLRSQLSAIFFILCSVAFLLSPALAPAFDPTSPASTHNALSDITVIRTNLNDLRAHEASATEPSNLVAGMLWYDTTNNLLKLRNEANTAWQTIWDFGNDQVPAGAVKQSSIDSSVSLGAGGEVRQTVLSSFIDSNGLPAFIAAGSGLSVDVDGTTPVIVSFAYGFADGGPIDKIGSITGSENAGSLTANSTNYIYADRDIDTGAITLGKTLVQPAYQFTEPSGNQIPAMTSNNTPSGVASASTENSSSYAAWKAFDKVVTGDTGWVTSSGVTSGWLKYQFPTAQIITSYSITPGYSYVNTRAPKSWTFQGSNNGADWETLDTQTNITTWVSNTAKTYTISSPASYTYYKLDVTETGGEYVWVCELQMFGTADNQYWFDLSQYKMFQYVSGEWTEKQVVFLGEAVTGASTVSSVVNYALRGRYYGTSTSYPTTTPVSTSHNLGVTPWKHSVSLKCVTTDAGYAVGDIVPLQFLGDSTGYMAAGSMVDRSTIRAVAKGAAQYIVNKTTGSWTAMTPAKWTLVFTAERGW